MYVFSQMSILSVFKSSGDSNDGPGATDNGCSSRVYLTTVFMITNCVFDPQLKNHD